MLKTNPVILRPSGLADSPLPLIGLALRLFTDEPVFERVEDLSRFGMMRTMTDEVGGGLRLLMLLLDGGWNALVGAERRQSRC